MATPIVAGVFTGIPTYFRIHCLEARKGGTESYRPAGWHLAIHLLHEVPYDVELGDWMPIVEELTAALDDDDVDSAWKWFEIHYPRCAALIPRKRRQIFLEGVKNAHDDGRI